MKHLVSPLDFSVSELETLLTLAETIMDHPEDYAHHCAGKKLATLFFEPSTRTRLSFEAAMLELGGSVLSVSSAASSSSSKGESIADTMRIVGNYADVIAMRHYQEGAAAQAVRYALCPVINAGDGGHLHPTQTLTDLLTIRRKKGRFEGLTIGLCGDLKYGRTVHSLIRAMMRYDGVRFVLVHPRELALPSYIENEMRAKGCAFEYYERLEDAIDKLDVLYMTRVQQERFADRDEYLRLRDSYILDCDKMRLAKDDMIVLHPLPRVNEIAPEVDDDPRACYFYQALCGKFVRMALIATLLETAGEKKLGVPARPLPANAAPTDRVCSNPTCVTQTEQGILRAAVKDGQIERCYYCEHEL